MSLSKTDIERIDLGIKYPVFGFVREVQNSFPSQDIFYIIPELVTFLIFSYFYGSDCFNKNLCGPEINISNDGKMIDNTNGRSGEFSTVYGTSVIDSMVNAKHIWRFQTLGPKITYCLNFGIDNADGLHTKTHFYNKTNKAVYSYYTGGHIYSWKGVEHANYPQMRDGNEILTMTLEFKRNEKCGSLSVKVNEGKEVVIFGNVLRETQLYYRMAVCCSSDYKIKVKLLS